MQKKPTRSRASLVVRGRGPGHPVSITRRGLDQVTLLARGGLPLPAIAASLGISVATLKATRDRDPAVAEAFAIGRGELVGELVSILVDQARGGYGPAAMFLLKTLGGFRETGPAPDAVGPQLNVAINLPGNQSREDFMKMITVQPVPPQGGADD